MMESRVNTILNQYLRETRMYCYYELKVAKKDTFTFSKIETNQDEGLPALQKEGLVWKFSDEDSRKKPCDGGCLPPLPAYLVIYFESGSDRMCCFILYEKIQVLRALGDKSVSKESAMGLSTKIVYL